MPGTRIPTKPSDFDPFMDRTDDYQLEVVPDTRVGVPPGSTVARYVLWGWTAAESAFWSGQRSLSNAKYPQFNVKRCAGTIKDAMHKIVTDTHHYDFYKKDLVNSHKLLDKIALFGTADDATMFNIKAGTPAASTGMARSKDPATITYSVIVLHILNLAHIIEFTRTQAGKKSHAKGKGIKQLQVWCFIGTTEPTDLTGFKFVGHIYRGKFTSKFNAATDKKKTAWYYVVAENTHCELSQPSPLCHADITISK
ncbi:MAG: hypothetical protein ACYDCN_09415 [Bacteroidia bacterium]